MTCKEAKNLLPSHAGSDLDDEQRAALEEHLAQCESCARELAAYRESLSALKAVQPPADVSEHTKDYWEGVRSRAVVTPPRPGEADLTMAPSVWRLPRYALATAALLLLGIAIGVMGHRLVVKEVARQIAKHRAAEESQQGAIPQPESIVQEEIPAEDDGALAIVPKEQEPKEPIDGAKAAPTPSVTTYHIGEATTVPASYGRRSF